MEKVTLNKGFKEIGKRTKERKNAKAERYKSVCSFLGKERPLWLTLSEQAGYHCGVPLYKTNILKISVILFLLLLFLIVTATTYCTPVKHCSK